jgi:hypothetical protein
MSNPNPPAAPAAAPRWLLALFVIGLTGLTYFLYGQTTIVAAGSDSSGYMNCARLLARGELTAPQRIPPEVAADALPYDFMPLGYNVSAKPGFIVPTYPQGLPMHLAVGGLTLGWRLGPHWIIVGSAVAAILLCYVCAREIGVSPPLAMAGAAALALSPLFLFSSVQPLSDTLAMTWCVGAVWLALRARRGSLGWAWGCGMALAMAVLVRPSNLLLLPCLVVLLGGWRRLFAAGLGGLPGALWLAYSNQLLYGHPLLTGYGSVLSTLEARYFLITLEHTGLWVARLLPAGLLLLPLALVPRWRERARLLLALAIWWTAFIVFYSFYPVTHEVWWSLRFILPALPALILAAVLGLDLLCERAAARAPLWRYATAGALILWSAAVFQFWVPRLGLLGFSRNETAYLEASTWARKNLPADAIVATMPASGALYYYTGFPILRWDSVKPETYQRYAAAMRAANRPVYAMMFPGEETRAFTEHMPDKWEKVEVVAGITFWKLAASP